MSDHTHRSRDAKPRLARRPIRSPNALARHLAPPTPRERAALAEEPVTSPAPATGRVYGYTRVSTDMQAEHGVTLYLLDVDGADLVTGNGKSKLFLSMLGAFAEFEHDRISTRIRESKQRQ